MSSRCGRIGLKKYSVYHVLLCDMISQDKFCVWCKIMLLLCIRIRRLLEGALFRIGLLMLCPQYLYHINSMPGLKEMMRKTKFST